MEDESWMGNVPCNRCGADVEVEITFDSYPGDFEGVLCDDCISFMDEMHG